MRLRLFAAVPITLIMCALAVTPAHAQLSTYVDDGGNLVFTNANPAPERPTAKKTSQPADASTVQTTSALTTNPAKPAPAQLDSLVQESAEKHHVDPNLVRAVISTESNWNTAAVSRKGAQGLMQLIPTTAQKLGVGNAFDPAQNVDAGVRYLGMLLERYKGDLSKALAAYNAGPGVVDRFGGVPNYRETRNYVQKVTATYYGPGIVPQAPPPPIYQIVQADGRIVFTNE